MSSLQSSVQFSHWVVSNSFWLHEPQHTRPRCPSPTAGVYPNPCPTSWWCHPTISPSIIPFSSHPQSFLASGSFQMSQLFASGDQSIGVSASTSVLPMNTQDWSPLGWTGCVNLFYSEVGRDKLSIQELNKGTFVYSQAEGQGPSGKPLSMIIIIKVSQRNSFQQGVRIGTLPAPVLFIWQ